MIRIISLVAVLLLSGCASQLSVTYDSDPPGAVFYSAGQRMGYTPQTVYYNISDETQKRGFMNLNDAKVQWASGAIAETKSLNVDLKKFGYSQSYIFKRPDGIPGREIDERFALELDRTRAMQRQAAAQEEQAAAQHRQAAAQEEQAAAASRSRNCTSTVNGKTVNKSCN